VVVQAVSDRSSDAVRGRLQARIDGSEGLPAAGAPDEYAALFEAVYPAQADRTQRWQVPVPPAGIWRSPP
jgi:hypothetical protein